MNRSDFLKHAASLGALALLPLPQFLWAQKGADADEALMKRLVAANDAQAEKLLQTGFDNRGVGRRLAHEINTLAASYCSPGSRYYHNRELVAAMQKRSQQLLAAQSADGTVNAGNLESPPDTGFIVELLTAACTVLQKETSPEANDVKSNLKKFLLGTGEALVAGGVHTPNHRWVISAALARLNALFPNKKYVDRINEWLSEGIYQNADGNYAERSRIYSLVENTAFLSMARLLNKPSLYQPVRKNLQTTYYYTEPNGDLVPNDSRRQDQWVFLKADAVVSLRITNYYLLYRHMALQDNNSSFAAVAKWIEGLPDFEERILNRSLIHFLEEPLLQKNLPASAPMETTYEKLFPQSHLLRIRRNDASVTLFGGTDQPVTIASGRSSSPDFFSFRKGEALLKYLRLSTTFFSTGYFYSDGLQKTSSGYVLQKKLEAPYYQPLPKNLRKANGDYALTESTDGRFWNKMDFKRRPQSNVKTLNTKVTLTETGGAATLLFDVQGQPGVPVTLELCFREGGQLSGLSAPKDGNYFLADGTARYRFGNDEIQFGPGVMKHQNITGLEGERYSTHFGSLRTEGMHVYLTGVTPFVHELSFR